ncbi:copper-translocating P-t [Whalleya microplaca]|nr:copper-translocating P-t [Whalleya microplaca]
MACGSGCCGPPASPAVSAQVQAQSQTSSSAPAPAPASSPASAKQQTVDEKCQDECCADDDVASCQDDCCGPEESKASNASDCCKSVDRTDDCCAPQADNVGDGCKATCCATSAEVIQSDSKDACCAPPAVAEDSCKDNCCAPPTATEDSCKDSCCAPPVEDDDNCEDACCAAPNLAASDPNEPDCCKGKSSPCCDASCLERLARRSCENDKLSSSSQCSGKNEDGKPCSKHTRTTRERYAAKLEALGCICRALLALGQESCCAPKEQSSVTKRRSSGKARASVDSCCAATTTSTRTCNKSTVKKRRSKDSCSRPTSKLVDDADSCAGGDCCDEKKVSKATDAVKAISHDTATIVDLERGTTGSEHVIFSVSGMTCTGCETKLSRSLAVVPGIKNLKTSLVLSRAEFDINLATTSPTEVMKHLERTTEFKCERITNQGSFIDIIPPGNPQEFIEQDYPVGVSEMTLVDKNIVRVAFDAKIIGARDLLTHGFGKETPLKLAPLQVDPTVEVGSRHVRHVGYMTILSAILTIPVLVLAWAPLPEHEIAYGSASLALATIIQVVIAGPFYPKCFKALIFSRVIEMDLLIVLSTTTAYVFSVVAFGYLVSGHPLSTGEFFETSTLLVTLIMVGRYVGALARQKAVESISVRSLQTPTATLVGDDGETEIDARLLQYGDQFKVAPESRVPTDGTVVSGESEVDESMITGESRPVEKRVKSTVVAGSVNGSGALVVRLTRLPGENTISNIALMVDEAKLSKPKMQDLADKVASYFVPVVLCLTAITFVIWIAIGVAVRKQSGSEAVVNAITYAITVLIVSCPCAIGLAVPMVVVISSGVAADKGIIFKSAESIEMAYKTSHVVFDKTGTLTQGKLTVAVEDWAAGGRDESTASLLLGLVGSNKHPVSTAVASHLKRDLFAATDLKDVKNVVGKGVQGVSPSGHILRAGNSRWLGLSSAPRVSTILANGYTAFCFTINGSLAAAFGLEDSLRPDAVATVSKLQGRGITVSLISGDDDGAVRSTAARLNIPDGHVRSRCSPSDKKTYIQDLLATTAVPAKLGKKAKPPVVIFVGDGTNDAVALAQATIGIHINEGTDVAQSAADVVLMRPNLLGIVTAIDTSEAAVHRIIFNFGWSFVYNLFAILLAAGAFVNARIPPEFAGLGEIVSVLPVIAAAVLLRWSRI